MLAEENVSLDIWMDFAITKDIETRNLLISNYIHLVKIIVNRLRPKYSNHVEYDDFLSYGILGLMDAIEKYDYTKGVKFETYASIRIRGSIIDNIRAYDWVSSYLRQKLIKVEQAFEYLENKKGRPATEEEVADFLNISVKELKRLLVDYRTANIIYFDELLSSSVHSSLIKSENNPEEFYEKKEIKDILLDQMRLLPGKEKTVIALYYFKDMSLKQIGMIMGLSESRVSQIHSKAIKKLRTAISKVF